jgi:flavin reductase (DIM6/NTAB) family NADH-FMN oxidoreductase RutF
MAPTKLSNGLTEAFDKEALVKRNPHADFPAVQASRPDYDSSQNWRWSKTPNPTWQPGDGSSSSTWKTKKLLVIDPKDPSRTANANYKLSISSTVPRPIALVSTITTEGVYNVAPFSYFNAVSVDPPLYSVSFVGKDANDSLNNVLATGEMCISIISDWFLEAANFTSVNTPPHISEWDLAGLHPTPSKLVKPPHAAESAFSMECKVHSSIPILSKTDVGGDGKPVGTATLVLVEAIMYHVREDVIDEKRETIDIAKLRPVWRGGGITYGSCFGGFETERPEAFRKLLETERVKNIMETLEERK